LTALLSRDEVELRGQMPLIGNWLGDPKDVFDS
jgi:hypothetical protein